MVSSVNHQIAVGFDTFFEDLRQVVEFGDVFNGVLKSFVFALAIGVQFLADNASIAGSNSVPAQQALPFGTALIPTPEYHLATGPQVTIGPFLGLAFGP